jgi:hypothetical protein
MIGVICKDSERKVVEEFFQLFKTPWEFYSDAESYDVVIISRPGFTRPNAKLVIVCGPFATDLDQQFARARALRSNVPLVFRGNRIPLSGQTLCFEPGNARVVCSTGTNEIAGLEFSSDSTNFIRLGYNLFGEVESLLAEGQPLANATIPALELHIDLFRQLMIDAGISFIEIPCSPYGYEFSVCLTHDIDFVGIRRHFFDHTMCGFVYRATVGSIKAFAKSRMSWAQVVQCWKSVISLPLVYLGVAPDFWMLFDWFMKVEKGLSPTYFFIPFKKQSGEKVQMPHASRRASAYDISDIPKLAAQLLQEGCELGVHGIDAWHDVVRANEERKRLAAATGPVETGIRMHWLLRDGKTYEVLDEAGYDYDSTAGYNETPGYFCGTTQAFKPLNSRHLLELPLHIQDGALFYSKRMGLGESEAWDLCECFVVNAQRHGGVLTVLWHDRSPGPERFWGDFYVRLVERLKQLDVWFARGSEVVAWFRRRRGVRFERVESLDGTRRFKLAGLGRQVSPAFKIRIYSAACKDIDPTEEQTGSVTELAWDGDTEIEIGAESAARRSGMGVLAISTCE